LVAASRRSMVVLTVVLRVAGDALALASAAGRARGWTYPRRGVGRPRTDSISGFRRIHGELVGVAIALAPSDRRAVLLRHGIEPAPRFIEPGSRRVHLAA
jgi:hypothetical protein